MQILVVGNTETGYVPTQEEIQAVINLLKNKALVVVDDVKYPGEKTKPAIINRGATDAWRVLGT